MRYTPFSYSDLYGMRLQRLTLDGGCTFCDNAAFHPRYTKGKSIEQQIEAGIEFHSR